MMLNRSNGTVGYVLSALCWFATLTGMVLLSSCAAHRNGAVLQSGDNKTAPLLSTNSERKIDSVTAEAGPSQAPQDSGTVLSPASALLVRACNNYLEVNPDNPKAVDVFQIKASLFYNNRLFDSARAVYRAMVDKYNGTSYAFEAIRMTAQSFYEEKKYDMAGEWYKKLSEVSSDSTDQIEAKARIAESIFRLAEINETNGMFDKAAQEYERVSLEYPGSKIADVALFNAGLSCEKLSEWSRAILLFERLIQKYPESKLNIKTRFRIGKNYERLQQWDMAAGAYLRIPADYPADTLASVAMFNAGFCFENGEKYREAAAIFEKMIQLFPNAGDAADVLFRAGELYGKVKDWESVARVTSIFSKRFGNDENRIVQALCMTGVAHYMRGRVNDALRELENAVSTHQKLKNPGTMNAFYAAKALFTIGEIKQASMVAITLGSQDRNYRKRLSEKSELLEDCIKAYAAVIRFNLSEWTTRSIYQIGQAYEDFAIGVFSQERSANMPIDKRIALEMGIAQAVDKYFMKKALVFHERNVKLGIAEKIEDRYIMQSRRKLTYLPYVAAENYLAIVEISKASQQAGTLDGFALIASKLQLFQKIAPFQKRAIELYLECLEKGAVYQEQDEYYTNASASITGLSLSVGNTYSEVVEIARNAPIPAGFDDYEVFVYKTKLLRQIEEYEDQALENYLKTIKIADAYKISDSSVVLAKQHIGELLFKRGRCYDLLCINAFTRPPFPRSISADEKEEYKVRFEEIGLKFQDQAFDIYKNVLAFAEKSYAAGPYVKHAYIRLYQNDPEVYGVKKQEMVQTAISSGSQWKTALGDHAEWSTFACKDSSWSSAGRAPIPTQTIAGFPGNVPIPMWHQSKEEERSLSDSLQPVLFRRVFSIEALPSAAYLYLAAQGRVSVFCNTEAILPDTSLKYTSEIVNINLMGTLRKGTNLIAIKVLPSDIAGFGVYPLILFSTGTELPVPQPPGMDVPISTSEASADVYVFPFIKNFSLE